MKFRILSHIADVWIEVYGKTVEELFENAVLGLAKIQKSSFESIMTSCEEPKTIKIRIASMDIDALLVDFLNEILAKAQINKMIYRVKDLQLSGAEKKSELMAKLSGFPIDYFDEDVKAVTHYGLKIKKLRNLFKVKVLLDI